MKSSRIGFCKLKKYAQHIPKINAIKKSWRRSTLAQASPALPSTMEPLTSVFGMGTGVTTPLWSPAKKLISWELKRITTFEMRE